MNFIENINSNRTIKRKYHFIFWGSYFAFNVLRWGSYFDNYYYAIKSNLIELPLHIILVYANLYFLIPKFLVTKKYQKYVFFLFLSLCIQYIIRKALNYFLVANNIWAEASETLNSFTFNHVVAIALGELYILALATAIKLTIDWVNQKTRIESLEKEQLKSELNFLKTQIQPHFFFNTLNNLYSLTLEKSNQVSDVVLKLSDIMQYVIYEVKASKVPLLKEIDCIQNYLDLERLRCHKNSILKIDIKGDINRVKIPPLIFLSYIENSFKHGNRSHNDFCIYISFEKTAKNSLIFTLKNSYDSATSEIKTKNLKKGVGNLNSKRRLDLIYKDNYELKISKKNNTYKVYLEIPLTKK